MPFEFKLPDIGEGTVEGEIVKWLVKPGDRVKADQPIVEVMTDKATVELTAPRAGKILEIRAKEGEKAAVGSVIYTIGEDGEAAAAAAAPAAAKPAKRDAEAPAKRDAEAPAKRDAEAPAKRDAEAPAKREPERREPERPAPSRPRAAPATRRLAKELGVRLEDVRGSGDGGRITPADVKQAAEGEKPAAPGPEPAPEAERPAAVAGAPMDGERVERVPFRGVRRKIAEHMTRSKQRAAHFTYVEEVDVTEVVRLREDAKPRAEKQGIKLTYLPFVIKAVIPALRKFPLLNAELDEEKGEIVLKHHYHLGVSVDTEQGLIVPVVKHADRRSVFDIARELTRLAEAARRGKVAASDLKGSTFTITSAGNLGGVLATPIINYPEVAILGVNQIKRRPVVAPDGQSIVVRDMVYLSISLDHRVVDGAMAARFMNEVKWLLEDPRRLVLES